MTRKSANVPELKEYVFLITSEHKSVLHFFSAWSQGVWATDPDDGYRKLASWKDRGYSVKFLHSMDDFRRERNNENDLKEKMKNIEKRNSFKREVKIEVENV